MAEKRYDPKDHQYPRFLHRIEDGNLQSLRVGSPDEERAAVANGWTYGDVKRVKGKWSAIDQSEKPVDPDATPEALQAQIDALQRRLAKATGVAANAADPSAAQDPRDPNIADPAAAAPAGEDAAQTAKATRGSAPKSKGA